MTAPSCSHRVPFSLDMFERRMSVEELAYHVLDHGPTAPSRGKRRETEDHLEMLAREFSGQSLLSFRHAWLIVRIRRGEDRDTALAEFRDLWDRHGALLAERLDLRWLISAADTFLSHPRSHAEAASAMTATLTANIAKLYETERLCLGVTGEPRHGPGSADPLFDGMTAFKVGSGDMMVNLVSRVREQAIQGPTDLLARSILDRLFAADTVLRRMVRVHDKPATLPAFGQKTVALLNDTSRSQHYGCAGVMQAFDDMMHAANARVIYRHHVGDSWQDSSRAKAAMKSADLVLVNGEGSIHHSSSRARDLAAIGPFCRENAVRAALVNATIEANDDAVMRDLAQFDHIWVRESASAAELGRAGIDSAICPDMTLTLPERQDRDQTRTGQVFVDSVVRDANAVLAAIAQGQGKPLLVMKRQRYFKNIEGVPVNRLGDIASGQRKIGALTKGLDRCPDHQAFRDLIAGARGLTTGRYHALCFALLERTPFAAIRSNTVKIEAMLQDIGLGLGRLFESADGWHVPPPFSDDEMQSISTYLRRARAARDRMAFALFGR